MTAATKTHSPKRVIFRVVLIAVILFALAAAAAGFNWINNMYLAFNAPILTGSDPFKTSPTRLEDIDKLTDSDKAAVKKLLDENNIPYKEKWGTTIMVRNGSMAKAANILQTSGYEFDGFLLG